MLFNSYEFIFIFLPITFFTYFFLNSKRLIVASKTFLVFSSLFFYSYWNPIYLPIILTSMIFNYAIGNSFNKNRVNNKIIFLIGILFNLGLLGYFKYADFFIKNINYTLNSSFDLLHLTLPLAISFFTFQQIAYLVDSYRGETKEYDFLNYALFVTFFPQLIAGPIVHHKEMMPQFAKVSNLVKNYKNIAMGLFIFSIGLFKKVVIADTFSIWANAGFESSEVLTFFEAWATSLSYTFQLYFDFSGYTDMAIGIALLFNIKLPINFNSPYKALNIQDFWRRWHITLSRFLKDYIYIPLGGNRKSEFKTYGNLMITFLIGGLWHGAGWTFVFWGFLHGLALIIHRIWQKFNMKMNTFLAWFITFNFINISWIFFRAKEFGDAINILKAMFGLTSITIHLYLENRLSFLKEYGVKFEAWYIIEKSKFFMLMLFVALILIFLKNSMELLNKFKPNVIFKIFTLIILFYSLMNFTQFSDFLYFNF